MLKDSKSRGWEVRRAKRDESSESRKRGVMLKSLFKSISRQKKGHKIKDTASIFKSLTDERCMINTNGCF